MSHLATPENPHAEALPIAISAAERAGEVLCRCFRELEPGDVSEKTRNDFVSLADRASEDVIRSYLALHTPQYGFLGEETGATGSTSVRWVVDPLDGTANYVHGFPHFAVTIALVDGPAIALGVVLDPIRGELYSCTCGGGAFCNGRRLAVRERAGLGGAFVTTGFPFRVHRHIDTYLRVFRDVFTTASAIRRPGAAALDLAHTAAGIFDAFFEFNLSPWDIAAGTLLIREAGGVVTNLDGGDDVFASGNVVAGGVSAQRELLAVVQRYCREAEIVA
jgi:myo-inositol-1(or 4)-monophosphatase